MDTRNDIALAISAATGMDAAELLSYIAIPPATLTSLRTGLAQPQQR